MKKFEFVFTTWSTLGVENLVKNGKTGLIFNNKLDSQPLIMKSSDEQKIIREIWLLEKY